jgi:putative lipoic acid-binding regulatory protein
MTNTNGKGKKTTPDAFKGKEIEFPVTYQIKAVMTGSANDEENKGKLEEVFKEQEVDNQYLNKKMSSKGAYTSYTYQVTLNDRVQMDKLYAALKEIKELKFAI